MSRPSVRPRFDTRLIASRSCIDASHRDLQRFANTVEGPLVGPSPENPALPRSLRRRYRLAAASNMSDDRTVTEDELILQIKYKCTVAAARFRSSQDEVMPEEMRAKDWQMFLDHREFALSETAKLKDEFSKGFAQHQVVKMLTVAGEDDLARKIIPEIEMDIAREGAIADFLSGADACFDRLMGTTEPEEESPEPEEEPITGWARFKIKFENAKSAFIGFLFIIAITIILPLVVIRIGFPLLGFKQQEWTPLGVPLFAAALIFGIGYYAYRSFKTYQWYNDEAGVGRSKK